ncbi:MAG: adenine phosphoribosyltransferase [candidate division Zixibacteria bacterium]|nr:adenine phosphoribosyltransferase [candidate division Zixibacteria bacterium]
MDLTGVIRSIPDFPKTGVVFRDITTLLQNPEAFRYAIDAIYDRLKTSGVTAIVGIESRGFIFGAPLAYMLDIPFIPVRKPGKLPFETVSATYELEYGTDSVEIHKDALSRDDKIAIVDDLLATGGTATATARLVESLGARVEIIAFIIELSFLRGRSKLEGYNIFSLVDYGSE